MGFIKSISCAIIVALIAIVAYNYYKSANPETIVISTKFGQLKGYKSISRGGRSFSSFTAIPYAKPPIGEARFKPPTEFGNWNGIQDATGNIPKCIQADLLLKSLSGQEDCLVLNVYSPNVPEKNAVGHQELLPVMVWFHGGHWMFGTSAIYGPQYFLDEDVVLVTVNYRLGAFGFLNTGDDVVSGNMGLKDQVLALKWIQATIKNFGGDPNLVTIFGESAGGAIADFHTLSPLSKGLFHRSISQSGSVFCPWVMSSNTKAAAIDFGSKFNCPTESSEKLVSCLRKVDAMKLVEPHGEIFNTLYPPEVIFGPSVENVKNKASAFLTELPSKILQDKRVVNKVPHLFGVTSEDGCYPTGFIVSNEAKSTELTNNWKKQFPNLFIYNKNVGDDAAEKILKHYFGLSSISSTTNPELFTMKNYVKFTEALSERYFWKCTRDSALLHSSSSDTYMYWLSYQNSGFGFGHVMDAISNGNNILVEYLKKTMYDAFGVETADYGVSHLDDLLYLFDTLPFFKISTSSPHYEFSRALVKVWVKFAKDGNPGTFKGVEWIKVNPKDSVVSLMKLDKNPGMIKETFTSAHKFWDSLNI